MSIQDEVRALLAADFKRGGRYPASPELSARAPGLLATLCDKLDEAEVKVANVLDAIGDINVELQGEREAPGAAIARARNAEAAIERVRALCNRSPRWPSPGRSMTHVQTRDILAALDGES